MAFGLRSANASRSLVTSAQAWAKASRGLAVRRRVGYMSPAFSLYTELTVRQNLDLHARLFALAPEAIPARIVRRTAAPYE